MLFDRIDLPEIAATIYGATTRSPATSQTLGLAAGVDHLHHTLDTETFDDCVRTGAAEAVRYTHHHINTTRQHQPDQPRPNIGHSPHTARATRPPGRSTRDTSANTAGRSGKN